MYLIDAQGSPISNCVWTMREKKNSINGDPQPAYNTLDLCQRGCIANLKCLAIDYDTGATPMCWFHYNAADIVDLFDNPTCNQFVLTRNPGCSGKSTVTFIIVVFMYSCSWRHSSFCFLMKLFILRVVKAFNPFNSSLI